MCHKDLSVNDTHLLCLAGRRRGGGAEIAPGSAGDTACDAWTRACGDEHDAAPPWACALGWYRPPPHTHTLLTYAHFHSHTDCVTHRHHRMSHSQARTHPLHGQPPRSKREATPTSHRATNPKHSTLYVPDLSSSRSFRCILDQSSCPHSAVVSPLDQL